KLGLITEERYDRFLNKMEQIETEKKRLSKWIIKPGENVQHILKQANGTPLKEAGKARDLLKRPEITYAMLEELMEEGTKLTEEVKNEVEMQIQHEGHSKK